MYGSSLSTEDTMTFTLLRIVFPANAAGNVRTQNIPYIIHEKDGSVNRDFFVRAKFVQTHHLCRWNCSADRHIAAHLDQPPQKPYSPAAAETPQQKPKSPSRSFPRRVPMPFAGGGEGIFYDAVRFPQHIGVIRLQPVRAPAHNEVGLFK